MIALLRTSVLLVGLTVCSGALRADEPSDAGAPSIADMDLEGLVKVRIRIASIDAKPVEAQPAVVTVITAKEIERSGARDLKDILQLVPGFTAGLDVSGAVGPGFRGIWAYEGKVQVLLDGIEMNEGLFANVPTAPSILAAEVLLHTSLNYQWRQLEVGAGVRDLLDTREVIGQPHNGGSGPLRLSGRTFFAQVGFRFHDAR